MSNLLGLEEENRATSAQYEPDHTETEARMKGGANWFYWIAGLSVVNSLVYMSGSEWSFLAGLGVTQIAEALVDVAIESGAPSAMKAIALVFSLIAVVVFGLFGYYSNKRYATVFAIGIVLYMLDGLLLLVLGVFASAGFHAFALFFMIRGFLACRELNAYEKGRGFQRPPPPTASYPGV
jgi:hypothetical protein